MHVHACFFMYNDKLTKMILTYRKGRESTDPETRSLCTVRSPDNGMKLVEPAPASAFYSDIMERMMDGAAQLGSTVRELLPRNYRPDKTLEQSILDLDSHQCTSNCICQMQNGVLKINPACPERGLRVLGHEDLKSSDETDHFETWEQLLQHAKLFVQVLVTNQL
jgi:hypothetical protein